jgi:hypothetical protein
VLCDKFPTASRTTVSPDLGGTEPGLSSKSNPALLGII